MRSKKESLLLPRLLKRIAPKIGARVEIEPIWGIAGQITFENGRKSYFRYNTLDLNPVGASEMAKDKDYAAFFMRRMGYPAVQGKAFYSDDWCEAISSDRDSNAAYRYAERLGFPVIVKPNSGSQGGGVALVHGKHEFYAALRAIFKRDRIALVQRQVKGRDFRIVVLDDDVISAYERLPLSVIGNGRSTILQLLKRKQRAFDASSRDTHINLNDPRISAKLKHQGRTLKSIPKRGEQIFLLDNANLSSGGDSVDVTDALHPAWKKLAMKLTRDMGLRLSGVDLMTESDITKPPKKFHILEINAAPGLDHYVRTGEAQKKTVEAFYLKVLKHLARTKR
jgi:D-alanine-D-alanine ligase-like ATP-grasp enzyme